MPDLFLTIQGQPEAQCQGIIATEHLDVQYNTKGKCPCRSVGLTGASGTDVVEPAPERGALVVVRELRRLSLRKKVKGC